jgi:GNAT acetyltransferase-like protein
MSVFQSYAWQKAWWNTWGDTDGFEPLSNGTLPAAGLYIDRYLFKRILPVRCLQFVGTNYRRISTPRTEYNCLTSVKGSAGCEDTIGFRSILSSSWSEAVFGDMPALSDSVDQLRRLAESRCWLWRIVAEDTAYSINTAKKWQDYVDSLGRNTRLRLFNRRNILEQLGKIDLSNAWPRETDQFFELLNRFHVKRWGTPCFNNQSLAFHRAFLSLVVHEGGEPELSVLSCGGHPISVLYNVVFEGCVYNIQAGFEADFHKKLAVGTLHLGYSIEEAFKRQGVIKFDLLAGEGKHENYKARLATDSEQLVSVMLVRSRLFRMLYRLKDF